MSPKSRLFMGGLVAIFALISVGLGAFVYKQTELIIYFFKGAQGWEDFRSATCTKGRLKYVFGDLRPGVEDPRKTPIELSCKSAMKWPVTHHFTKNKRGVKIHYQRYLSEHITPKTPILLYVHGVGDNAALANRYVKMAQRLNFELVAMETTNHGQSGNEGRGAAYGCREKDDLLAILADFKKLHPKRNVLLFGTSMGAMTLANAVPEMTPYLSQVRGAILENSPTSLQEMLSIYAKKLKLPESLIPPVMTLTQWRTGYSYSDCAPLKKVKGFQVPVMVNIYEKDHMIPLKMAHQIYESLPKGWPHELHIYPHGAHSAIWNGQPKVYEADIIRFWNSALKSHQQQLHPVPMAG